MGAEPNYVRLVEEVLGVRGAPPELARRLVAQALVVEDRHESWRRVGARVRKDAPSSPGIYVLRDGDGQAIYVGKAANLRRRLAAQFADRRWRALHPAMARVARVECQEVGSELEALMREATLIQKLQPIANIQTGQPALRTRAIPSALLRDVVLLVPSLDRASAELVAAKANGESMLQRTPRDGVDLVAHTGRLWEFFHRTTAGAPATAEDSLAPLVFSWLAGRGRETTRVYPDDVGSAADLCANLAALLKDQALFVERLVAM
jgi:predicted GIY-YIG superfamily endonuclease